MMISSFTFMGSASLCRRTALRRYRDPHYPRTPGRARAFPPPGAPPGTTPRSARTRRRRRRRSARRTSPPTRRRTDRSAAALAARPCHQGARPSMRRIPAGTIGERMCDARRYLGEDSPLDGALPGFRVRGEQLALADAVAACLSGDGHLVAEAGTGVGKSLAYLVPAAFAGRTVVVSTYTKALQDQLRTNDVPLAREATGQPLVTAVVKGRGNYLCRAQLETVESRIELWDVDGWQRLRPWVQETRSGDRDT